MKKLSRFLGSLWLFLTALNLSAATSGDKIGSLSGTTPVINWNTEQIKTWTLSGNSTPTQSNVPGTTTQRFQLELLVTQPAAQNHTISTPSGWVWLSTDWSALPSDSTNRIVLEKLGSKVYATWVDEPTAPEFSLTPTFIPQASSATTLGDSTMSQVSVDTILQAGKFALGTLTNLWMASGADIIYTNNNALGSFIHVATPSSSKLASYGNNGNGDAIVRAGSGQVVFLQPDLGSVSYTATTSYLGPASSGKTLGSAASNSQFRELLFDAGGRISWNGTTNTLFDLWGSGSPEGVITALSGSLYRDAANGNIYKKASGSGNTGWENLSSGSASTAVTTLFRSGTAIDVANTSAETAIWTNSITGNTLGTNKTISITLTGDFLNNTGGTSNFTFRVYYGSTKLYDDQSPSISTGTGRGVVKIIARLSNLDADNSQNLNLTVQGGSRGAPTTGTGALNSTTFIINGVGQGTSAIDSTAAQGLGITVQPSAANANLSFRIKHSVAVLE